jgi:uncharacterized membrane protein YphA (DoxX/SURF4 family)
MKSGNWFPVFLIRVTLGLLFTVVAVQKLNDMDRWLEGKPVPVVQPSIGPSAQTTEPTVSEKAASASDTNRRGGLYNEYNGKIPHGLLVVFGHILPFVELLGGLLLLTGFLPRWSLRIMGLTLLALTFGAMLTQDMGRASADAIYLLTAAVALKWSSEI